jgi:hypothetical protein
VIGFFDTYGEATDVVRDLELAGIVGEQVELVSATEEEVPFAANEAKNKLRYTKGKRSGARLLCGGRGILCRQVTRGTRRGDRQTG